MGSGICTVISDLCNKRSPERGRLCKIILLVNITHSPLSGARTAHSLLPRPPLTRRTGIVIPPSLRLSEYAFWKCFYSCRFLTFQPGFAAAPSFASRLGWLTHYSRLCSENSCILPDRTKRKTLEIKWFSAFCGRSSDFLVIRLEPLNSNAVWWVSASYQPVGRVTHLSITLILQCSAQNCKSCNAKLQILSQSPISQTVKNAWAHNAWSHGFNSYFTIFSVAIVTTLNFGNKSCLLPKLRRVKIK